MDSEGLLGNQPERNTVPKNRFRVVVILLIAALATVVGLSIYAHKLKQEEKSEDSGNKWDWLAAEIDATRNISYDPCDNFYLYACQGWFDKNPLPDDAVRLSRSFNVIADRNKLILKKAVEDHWPVIGTFYDSCMDTETIERLGLQPIDYYLASISAATTKPTLMRYAGVALAELKVPSFFSVAVVVDAKNPEKNILNIGQGGLTMPSVSHYKSEEILSQYKEHIFKMYTFMGAEEADARQIAEAIAAIEKRIADNTVDQDQIRDPHVVYNKYTFNELKQAFGYLEWDSYFEGLGVDTATLDANVEVPRFLSALNSLVEETELADLKQYLRWKILHAFATRLALPKVYTDENFNFFGKVIQGQAAPEPRWKTCVDQTDALLGDILGRYFVERAFPESSKDTVVEMIKSIKQAFEENLPNVDWMDQETREAARQKLYQVEDLIGYPANWTDYSSVWVQPAKYGLNQINLSKFAWQQTLQQLNSPADRTRWQMTPPTVNAYYDPSYNTINFPAGIIQPTFFNASYPASMNYGGIGMVMGHELTHGFDDQGREYDGTGKLTPWWSASAVERFKERASCFVKQYNDFIVPEIDMHVNGNLTLGENIADNGGIRLAYFAFKAHEAKYGVEPPVPTNPPLTHDQLFFLAFAQGWCTKVRPEYAKILVENDVHSPAFARVLGPLRNFDAFAKAWNCPVGSPMNPKEKCVLW